jgi:hypothetical protein
MKHIRPYYPQIIIILACVTGVIMNVYHGSLDTAILTALVAIFMELSRMHHER